VVQGSGEARVKTVSIGRQPLRCLQSRFLASRPIMTNGLNNNCEKRQAVHHCFVSFNRFGSQR
jgi:hypothetical protein